MKKILLIDDDRLFLKFLEEYVGENYPTLDILTCDNAMQGLSMISADLDLLLLDLELPDLDGSKLLSYALEKGVDKKRIIILSGHDADYLHERFPMGRCLAVLNKHEVKQKAVLDMVLNSLHKKPESD